MGRRRPHDAAGLDAEEPALRWAVPVLCAAAAVALARLVVRWVPDAGGSGVQRVEANMRSEIGFAPWQVVPAKFIGGFLAIGAGLALGREGPSVQMGAAIGSEAGRIGGVPEHDRRTLSAALAGAGLGVAFSAPLGGAVFVFEEVSRAVRTRLVVTTLAGSAAAVAVAHQIVADGPILPVPDVASGPMWTLALFAALGVLLGGMGVAYNRVVILFLDWSDRLPSIPPEAKAAVIGALVGLLGILSPAIVGGGEELNEAILLGRYSLGGLLLVLVRPLGTRAALLRGGRSRRTLRPSAGGRRGGRGGPGRGAQSHCPGAGSVADRVRDSRHVDASSRRSSGRP